MLFDPNFWPHVAFCIKTIIPLFSVLREVDLEKRPTLGYIYELMNLVKEMIAFNCVDMEKNRCKMDSATSSTFICSKLLS